MRIALTGHSFTGKSSLAHVLQDEFEWDRLDYTHHLKELAAAAFNAAIGKSYEPMVGCVNAHEISYDKEAWRPFLIALGERIGFDEGCEIRPMVLDWARKAHLKAPTLPNVVFDNVRFEAQADILREHRFFIVGLLVSQPTRVQRGLPADTPEFNRHGMFPVTPDIILDGERPVRELAEVLNRLAGSVK